MKIEPLDISETETLSIWEQKNPPRVEEISPQQEPQLALMQESSQMLGDNMTMSTPFPRPPPIFPNASAVHCHHQPRPLLQPPMFSFPPPPGMNFRPFPYPPVTVPFSNGFLQPPSLPPPLMAMQSLMFPRPTQALTGEPAVSWTLRAGARGWHTENIQVRAEAVNCTDAKRKLYKKRNLVSVEQHNVLITFFELNRRPNKEQIIKLASRTRLEESNVRLWFNNQRREMKRLEKAQVAATSSHSNDANNSSPSSNY